MNTWYDHRTRTGEPDEQELDDLKKRIVNEFWIACDERHIVWPDDDYEDVKDERDH